MNTYVVLLRGVNVGGKNPVAMAGLKKCLEGVGFLNVSTYIASGNVILQSELPASEVKVRIEEALPRSFTLDSELIKVLVLTRAQMKAIIDNRPEGFGDEPSKYHSDAIFLIDIDAADAMSAFKARDGVDTVWPGRGVVYSQRLSALRTKSRLNKVLESPLYKSMTIRNCNTATRLLGLLEAME
ncbi:MAG: DUF1697 domain-containing protein [SAR202 cluster bacterium]|nr:DUF1697 domain-containing protein [SAR202 cluster bacterium]